MRIERIECDICGKACDPNDPDAPLHKVGFKEKQIPIEDAEPLRKSLKRTDIADVERQWLTERIAAIERETPRNIAENKKRAQVEVEHVCHDCFDELRSHLVKTRSAKRPNR